MSESAESRAEMTAQAKASALLLARAFASQFGQPAKRTSDQRRVYEHLEKCAGEDGNSYRFGEGADGISKIAAGIHRDGAKSLLKIIDRQLTIAASTANPKAAVKVKR